nr:hypothetical protein P5627_03560 [Bacillus safensis]
MKTPLGKLRLKLLENQLKLKNSFTVEEYHEMKQSLHEIRMTFAVPMNNGIYISVVTDLITILLFQHALQQKPY